MAKHQSEDVYGTFNMLMRRKASAAGGRRLWN